MRIGKRFVPLFNFNYGIIDAVAHRPWPMPEGPWIMTQTWHDLLFAHWPIDAALLRSKVPAAIELDLFEGRAWLGIVPFRMTNVSPRGVPALPWLSAFPELNVRTYVRRQGRPGVYFFSLDASNSLAVTAARTLFHLPYFTADMEVEEDASGIRYRSRRTGGVEASAAEFVATYRPVGPVFRPVPGTLEHFLTERYCLYTTLEDEAECRTVDIHHPPWPLQPAAADIAVNTMAQAAGLELPATPPLLHFSRRQEMVGWPMRRC